MTEYILIRRNTSLDPRDGSASWDYEIGYHPSEELLEGLAEKLNDLCDEIDQVIYSSGSKYEQRAALLEPLLKVIRELDPKYGGGYEVEYFVVERKPLPKFIDFSKLPEGLQHKKEEQ